MILTVTKKSNLFVLTEQTDGAFTPEQFNTEQTMIKDMTEKFALNDILPQLPEIEKKQFDLSVQLIKQAGELGLIGAGIDQADGGLELGKVSETIIAESLGITRSFSVTFGGQTGIGALPIAYFGTEEQKQRYLPDILTGEKIAAYALTEPESGTDAMSLRTTAQLTDDGESYILNGEKQWITNSAFAHIFIVYAKVDGDKITAFIVEKDMKGLSTSPEESKMGLHGSSTRSLILDNVVVPKENIIGEIGRGHIIAFNVLNLGRFKIATSSLGLAKRAIHLAVTYGKERKQFKRSIIEFNLLKEKIAKMTALTYAMESAIYRVAGDMETAFNNKEEDGSTYDDVISRFIIECSLNKVFATESLDYIADEAVQIHGGYGYMEEYEVEAIYRDSRINRIFEGTNEINRIVIANTIFKESRSSINSINQYVETLKSESQVLTLLEDLFNVFVKSINEQSPINFNIEQELAAFIADLVTLIYIVQSVILRTEKIIKLKGKEKAEQAINCSKVFIYENIYHTITKATNFEHLFDNNLEIKNIVQKLLEQLLSVGNLVQLKRKVADAVIEEESYKI